MCPSSAAIPNPPRSKRPSVTIAPPTPVPTVSMTMWLVPTPAPKRYSAQPAAFASLSIKTGMSSFASSFSLNGSLRQDRLGAYMMLARSASMKPAAATPAATTLLSRDKSLIRETTASAIAFESFAGVGTLSSRKMRPSGSTRAPAILVPPISIPTAYIVTKFKALELLEIHLFGLERQIDARLRYRTTGCIFR